MKDSSHFAFAFGGPMNVQAKTPRKQPVQSRSKATCAAVTEATIQVLMRDGAEALTTTRVAERAGVSVGSLYQYFPNKAALIEAVRQQYFAILSDTVQTALGSAAHLPTEQKLAQAIEALVESKRENLNLNQAMAHAQYGRQSADFPSEIVAHFSQVVVKLYEPDRARALTADDMSQIECTVAAIEGALSYAVKTKPSWLAETWFTNKLVDIAATGLPR